jgi:hypothetical protein
MRLEFLVLIQTLATYFNGQMLILLCSSLRVEEVAEEDSVEIIGVTIVVPEAHDLTLLIPIFPRQTRRLNCTTTPCLVFLKKNRRNSGMRSNVSYLTASDSAAPRGMFDSLGIGMGSLLMERSGMLLLSSDFYRTDISPRSPKSPIMTDRRWNLLRLYLGILTTSPGG